MSIAAYDSLVKELTDAMGEEDKAEQERVKKAYEGTDADALEEYWCNRFGELLENPEALRKFSLYLELKNAGLGKRVLIHIREFIRSILDRMGGKDTLQERRLRHADQMVGKILDSLESGDGAPTMEEGGVKYMIQTIDGFGDTPVVTVGEFLPKSIAGNEKALETWIRDNITTPLNSANNVELQADAKHLSWSNYAQRANPRVKIARGRAIGIIKDIVSLAKIDDEHRQKNKHDEPNKIWENKITFALPQFDKGEVSGGIGYDAMLIVREKASGKYAYDITDLHKNEKLSERLTNGLSLFKLTPRQSSAETSSADSSQRVTSDNITPGENSVQNSVTPAEDAAYMKAVQDGDMETALRMVKETAAKAMPNTKVVNEDGKPKVVYHQTNSKRYINRFTGEDWETIGWEKKHEWKDRPQEEWEDTWKEKDFYTFDNRASRTSIEYPAHFFAPKYDRYHEYGKRTIAAYLNLTNPAFNPKIPNAGVEDNAGTIALQKLKKQGYDGFIREYDGEIEEYGVFDSSQIKSADAVTYDDAGNVIPLSQRFNPENNDIRYSVTENPEAAPEASDLDAVSAFYAPDQVTQIATFLKPVVMNYGADAVDIARQWLVLNKVHIARPQDVDYVLQVLPVLSGSLTASLSRESARTEQKGQSVFQAFGTHGLLPWEDVCRK